MPKRRSYKIISEKKFRGERRMNTYNMRMMCKKISKDLFDGK